ncbi:MAG TPA: aspartate carbamoyltransferase [Candidatus Saccharimonadales bacterium]|nr:aspartate carbamoyltransferase [Candidatus Saccharimonadales bacterium]
MSASSPSKAALAPLSHVVAAQQFDRERLSALFGLSAQMEAVRARGGGQLLPGRIMATLFYEPSTRTRLSFEAAMLRLGGQVIGTENARDFSSAIKGETLEDTVRIVAGYSDCIVLRHSEEGAAARAAEVSPVPVINAGDGPGQHPTQALLDLYTIQSEIGRLDDLHVVMVGDLSHGRTVHSLAYLLALYRGLRVTLVAPDPIRMSAGVITHLLKHGAEVSETEDLMGAVADADIVYQTRIQLERFSEPWDESEDQRRNFRISEEVMSRLPQGAIVMHPLPRVGEIDSAVDRDPRAAYFRQARNGVAVRMALLQMLLAG